MSFILDALKKSENERQRKIGPSLADVPVRRKKNERPWWVVAIAALLVVNLGVLAIVLLRSGGAADAKPAPMPEPAAGASPSIPVAPEAAPQAQTRAQTQPRPDPLPAPRTAPITSPARSLADEVREDPAETMGSALTGPAAAANVPAGPPMVRPIEPPSVAPLPARAAPQPQAPEDEVLPTHASLVAGGTNLPDLRLDIHVYSPNPSERFVYVNMRKYTEGQSLNEGATVERITSEGVVLNRNGLRFLLPRQ
jgi:general secretion pathway protein B